LTIKTQKTKKKGSKKPKKNKKKKKKGTATKREHVTVSIPKKSEIIMQLESDQSRRGYGFIQH